jgi:hypothetical protein
LTEKRNSDVLVTFFFARFDDQQSLKAETIIKSIARQALGLGNLSEEAETLLEKVNLSTGLTELLELLRIRITQLRTFYIIIDGLDECEKADRDYLLKALSSVMSIASNARLFLASRDGLSGEVRKKFPSLENLSMSCPSAQSDIATYIESAIDEKLESEDLNVGDRELVEEIRQALVKGAEGM